MATQDKSGSWLNSNRLHFTKQKPSQGVGALLPCKLGYVLVESEVPCTLAQGTLLVALISYAVAQARRVHRDHKTGKACLLRPCITKQHIPQQHKSRHLQSPCTYLAHHELESVLDTVIASAEPGMTRTSALC